MKINANVKWFHKMLHGEHRQGILNSWAWKWKTTQMSQILVTNTEKSRALSSNTDTMLRQFVQPFVQTLQSQWQTGLWCNSWIHVFQQSFLTRCDTVAGIQQSVFLYCNVFRYTIMEFLCNLITDSLTGRLGDIRGWHLLLISVCY